MSESDFEQRFQRHVGFMLEQQARFDEQLAKMETAQAQQATNIDRLAESVAGLIQVARLHGELIDGNGQQIRENSEQIKELMEGLREQRETVNALIRVVEHHVSNHP